MVIMIDVVGGNYRHTLDLWVISQDRSANTSLLGYTYNIHRNVAAASGAFVGAPGRAFTVTIGDDSDAGTDAEIVDSETKTFDFRSVTDLVGASGTVTFEHASDGSATVDANVNGPGSFVSAGMPITTGYGSLALPAIARNRAKVGVSSVWKDAEVCAGINGVWVPCKPYAGVSGVWKEIAP